MPNGRNASTGRSRLAACVHIADGITEDDALFLAENALELKRKSVNAEIDKVIDEINAAFAAARHAPSAEMRARLYEQANIVHSVAATFGRRGLGLAAYHMCELMDALDTQQRWDAEAVRVHCASITALREEEKIPPEVRMEMIEGLKRVVEKAVN